MKKKFPIDNPVLEAVPALDTSKRRTSSIGHIEVLAQHFSHIIKASEADRLLEEFIDFQLLADDECPGAKRIDQAWFEISKLRDPATEQFRFPVLTRLVMYVLLIPHSNAYCETIFSMVRKVQTDARSQLGRHKDGHAATSVYSKHQGDVRNSLCGILAAKVNIFCKIPCFEWKPSAKLLKAAHKATYTALKGREADQQQHRAGRARLDALDIENEERMNEEDEDMYVATKKVN